MSKENIGLLSPQGQNGFYAGNEKTTDDNVNSGISRRILHLVTIVSVLIAAGCTIYGVVQAESPLIALPFIIVIMWTIIHCLLIVFARNEKHEFYPPGWFIFVSSGHIVIESLVVMILTLFKK